MNNTHQSTKSDSIEWIDSSKGIAYEDLSDICTKRRVWWMRLINGQLKQVADTRVIINPFPKNGDLHYCEHEFDIKYDNRFESISEQRIYAETILEAGKWLGKLINL